MVKLFNTKINLEVNNSNSISSTATSKLVGNLSNFILPNTGVPIFENIPESVLLI